MRNKICSIVPFFICVLAIATSRSAQAENDPLYAAESCSDRDGIHSFVDCWNNEMMSSQQRAIVDCYKAAQAAGAFAACAHVINLSEDQARVANCAAQNGFNRVAFFGCIGASYLTPEQGRIADCVAQNPQNPWIATACVAGKRMTPEQQVIAACAIQTGMTPLPMAYCVGGQLTLNELDKCMRIGIGGEGCFGENNTVVQIVRQAWQGISGGPNSVLNNPGQILGGPNSIFNNPGQVWGGPNSMFNNPSQIWGGSNSVFNNPSQIWGGPNSVFNNPSQLFHW